MKPAFTVVFPNGKYTDKEGNEKTNWLRCGTLFVEKGEEGQPSKYALKIDAIPTSEEFKGWFNVFHNKPREGGGTPVERAQQAESEGAENTDLEPIDLSEIPF